MKNVLDLIIGKGFNIKFKFLSKRINLNLGKEETMFLRNQFCIISKRKKMVKFSEFFQVRSAIIFLLCVFVSKLFSIIVQSKEDVRQNKYVV